MRILIYTQNLNGLAGIERVVREHLRIFAAHGAECTVFGEAGCEHNLPPKGVERRKALSELVQQVNPDVCLLHGVSHEGSEDDVAVLRACDVPTVAVCHFSFPSALLLDGDEVANRNFLRGAKSCNLVATVSAIDAQWWCALGCRALHTQNPFVHPTVASVARAQRIPRQALWVGRVAPQKKPERALAVWAEVVKSVPDAQLTMIGGDTKSWRGLKKLARKLSVANNVTFLPAQDDLSALWQSADIHLLTSVTESFCLVLAEAKAWGLPTAMFEIPFLELVESGKGLVARPQGDIDGLAEGIIDLMQHPDKCRRLGEEAKASLESFNDEAVWQSWQRVFDALRTGQGGTEVSPEVRMIVSQMNLAWDDFCDRNLWAVTFVRDWRLLCRCSWYPVANVIASLVRWVRWVKAAFQRGR